MKTKGYIKLLQAFFLIFFVESCSLNDFNDMNVDKKSPSEAIPSYMLTNALRYIPENLLISSGPQVSFWMQYWTEIPYVSNEEYNMNRVGFPLYQSVLVNLKYIIDQNSDTEKKSALVSYGDNVNQIAIARIMKAYYFLGLTDRWGNIPYFNALQGDKGGEYLRPHIDLQKDVYTDLFKELTEAVAQINDNPVNAIKGDFLFNGDMLKWKKMANTTRLMMAMRISDVDPGKGKTEFNAALNAPGGIIESNNQNLLYPFVNDEEGLNYNYMYNWNNSASYPYALCKTLVDYMKGHNDPRLPYYADKAAISNDYVGQPVATIGEQSQFSRMGVNMRQKETPLFIYSYAQVLFTFCEASQRGWITTGTAAAYYNDAIKASLEQYHVYDPISFATYIQLSDVAFDQNKAYERIGYQKWVALYPYGNEAWAEWRRLGYPLLTPAHGALTDDGQIPKRFTYSIDLKTLMPEPFEENEKVQPDKTSTRVWWDVNP